MSTIEWFKEFEFDLPAALLRELTNLFDEMPQGPLNNLIVASIPEAQGVYQLFLNGELVYVGKTDAEAGLNRRLARHARKVLHRKGLDPERVSFKAVRIYVFTAMDLEQQLIEHYEQRGASLAWNMSGFGANDPGRERDTTTLKSTHFDLNFPINIDLPVNVVPGKKAVSEVLQLLKDTLPYTFRYEMKRPRSRTPHSDLLGTSVSIATCSDTVRNVLTQIKIVLGANWQITIQPGYVMLYKEEKKYPHGVTL